MKEHRECDDGKTSVLCVCVNDNNDRSTAEPRRAIVNNDRLFLRSISVCCACLVATLQWFAPLTSVGGTVLVTCTLYRTQKDCKEPNSKAVLCWLVVPIFETCPPAETAFF